MNPPDEIHFLTEGWRLLGRDVHTELLARGWLVADLNIPDDESLEFFWPPTAPPSYGDTPDRRDGSSVGQPPLTPWLRPTRVTRSGSGWHVAYGEAVAQAPDPTIDHADDASLLEDLPRIEWWPMAVEEASKLQAQRIVHTTHADAYDDHSWAYSIVTEPYQGRLRDVQDRIWSEAPMEGAGDAWWRGDLRARARIIDGEMWASAVRTARAGGQEWIERNGGPAGQ